MSGGRGTGRAGCGKGEGGEEEEGRGGENGDPVTYLKVVGIISIKCTQPEINFPTIFSFGAFPSLEDFTLALPFP